MNLHFLADFDRALFWQVQDINMGLKEIQEGLGRSPFLEARTDVRETPSGWRLSFFDRKFDIGRGDTAEQINAKLGELPQREATNSMSITGAANLAGTIKARIEAAKAKVAQVTQNTDGALARLNEAADRGDRIAKQIEAEANDLDAQLGQFTNE